MLLKVKKSIIFPLVAIFVAGMVLITGCAGGNGSENGNGVPSEAVELSGKITEAGSTSVLPLAEQLALAFMQEHPGVTITYTGGGSGAGASQCAGGTVDIGATSRDLKMGESDLISCPIARDGVAIVIHQDNPVNALDLEQVARIFEGRITDWAEVGGNPGSITIYNREEGSGTRDCFESMVTEEVMGNAITKKSNGELQLAIQGDPSGIAYVSLGYVQGVKPLALNGVECSVATCQSGEYPIVRRLYFHLKTVPDEPVKAFIDFCRSPEGQVIAEDMGYIPLVK